MNKWNLNIREILGNLKAEILLSWEGNLIVRLVTERKHVTTGAAADGLLWGKCNSLKGNSCTVLVDFLVFLKLHHTHHLSQILTFIF